MLIRELNKQRSRTKKRPALSRDLPRKSLRCKKEKNNLKRNKNRKN